MPPLSKKKQKNKSVGRKSKSVRKSRGRKLKRGGGNGDGEPPKKKRRIAMQTTHLQRLAVIPTFQEKVEELLDNFPGYNQMEGYQTIPELYKKEMLKLFDDISTYLTTQYAAELLNDKRSLYREKRDESFTSNSFSGSYVQIHKITIANWVSIKVSDTVQQNRMTSMPFKDENVWCYAYVNALMQAYEICKRCKTEEEKRLAEAAAAQAEAAAARARRAAAVAEAKAFEAKKRAHERAQYKKQIKKMEETFLDDFAQSLKLRYFPEQAKWLPDFDMTLLQKFKEAKEKFMEEHDDEVENEWFSSEQTMIDRVREVTQHAVKALLAPRGAILTLTDMAVGGVSQIFDLRGTDGAFMAWGSGNSIGGNNVKLVLQCSLDEKTENFTDFVDTTYHLPISTPETYATLNERLPAAPFVRFVVRGGALSHINVKVSYK